MLCDCPYFWPNSRRLRSTISRALVALLLSAGGTAAAEQAQPEEPAPACPTTSTLQVRFNPAPPQAFLEELKRRLHSGVKPFGARVCVAPGKQETTEGASGLPVFDRGLVVLLVERNQRGVQATLLSRGGRLELAVNSKSGPRAQGHALAAAILAALNDQWFVPRDNNEQRASHKSNIQRPAHTDRKLALTLTGRALAEVDLEAAPRLGAGAELGWWATDRWFVGVEGAYLKWRDIPLVLGTAHAEGAFVGGRIGYLLAAGNARPMLFAGAQYLVLEADASPRSSSTRSDSSTQDTARFVGGMQFGIPLAHSFRLTLRGLGGFSLRSLDVGDGIETEPLSGHALVSASAGLTWFLE